MSNEANAIFRIVISTKPENREEWKEGEPLYLTVKDIERVMASGEKILSVGMALYLVKKLGLLRRIGL